MGDRRYLVCSLTIRSYAKVHTKNKISNELTDREWSVGVFKTIHTSLTTTYSTFRVVQFTHSKRDVTTTSRPISIFKLNVSLGELRMIPDVGHMWFSRRVATEICMIVAVCLNHYTMTCNWYACMVTKCRR